MGHAISPVSGAEYIQQLDILRQQYKHNTRDDTPALYALVHGWQSFADSIREYDFHDMTPFEDIQLSNINELIRGDHNVVDELDCDNDLKGKLHDDLELIRKACEENDGSMNEMIYNAYYSCILIAMGIFDGDYTTGAENDDDSGSDTDNDDGNGMVDTTDDTSVHASDAAPKGNSMHGDGRYNAVDGLSAFMDEYANIMRRRDRNAHTKLSEIRQLHRALNTFHSILNNNKNRAAPLVSQLIKCVCRLVKMCQTANNDGVNTCITNVDTVLRIIGDLGNTDIYTVNGKAGMWAIRQALKEVKLKPLDKLPVISEDLQIPVPTQ